VPERAAEPQISSATRRLLRSARTLTTPLLPDDYIELINPMWSTRELRGRVEAIRHETRDTATVVIRPSFPWPGHRPGQYLRLGVEINGVRHWRAYTITSDPEHPDGLVSITVKCVEEGKLSPYFVRIAEPGQIVFLGEVEGTFGHGDHAPARSLFISAGSGITPIFSLLRSLDRSDRLGDAVHLYCMRTADDFIFESLLRDLERRRPGYRLVVRESSREGRLTPAEMERLCPDWRERAAFLSGPRGLLDSMKAHWQQAGDPELLDMERFQPIIGGDEVAPGAGGTVRFRVTDFAAECDGTTPILVGGEQAGGLLPFGCRMGICHTCVGRLQEGRVRDLRTGEVHGEKGQMIRTCVNCPEGHVEIDL
jgi:stearoyl-CoA 9-desaturase NADPH oxidoreductase